MPKLFHHLVQAAQQQYPQHIALEHKTQQVNYNKLQQQIEQLCYKLLALGVSVQENQPDRVAIYLGQRIEAVISFFAISASGGIFVPINPHLKSKQIEHIISDCLPKILITSSQRYMQLQENPNILDNFEHIILLDPIKINHHKENNSAIIHLWPELMQSACEKNIYDSTIMSDTDSVAILYTSGSTGKAKGVELSHKNLVCGAKSVAGYLNNNHQDKLLAVLPFSFDYGLSQLTSAFYSGATIVLLEYLLPRDVIKAVIKYQITGLAGVPPLWIQLGRLNWPDEAKQTLRYFTSSGGIMPKKTLQQLRQSLPDSLPYLMYGLTEAFRSTYLQPQLIDEYPDSIGKAIPNTQILLVNKKGKLSKQGEVGELVHCGPLVAKGYWNNIEASAKVFRPVNHLLDTADKSESAAIEYAVWSGDRVKQDKQGLLYFVERGDAMIKSSGYRISPTEVEEIFLQHELIINAVAIGVPHPDLGQAIVLVCNVAKNISAKEIMLFIKHDLPNFMCPKDIIIESTLPQTANGKIDRQLLSARYKQIYSSPTN
ncbi:MAG: acyl-CoA ligase (AMP-forming), exosortase A system-associated [Pseudomonadota bacterium]